MPPSKPYPDAPTPPDQLWLERPTDVSDLDLVPLRERRLAARVEVWEKVALGIGRIIGLVLWILYLLETLIDGRPIISL